MITTSIKYQTIDKLEVILKVTERCNIDCKYCYYFNGANIDHTEQPAHLSIDTINSIASYLRNAAIKHSISEMQIDLHGGEPLLLKKNYMKHLLEVFRDSIPDSTELKICVQTNATLLDNEWIALFAEYSVAIGVSLDGPPDENDTYRVDKNGKGTHRVVAAAIQKLIDADQTHPGIFAGVICVINPCFSGRRVYRHFIDDLKIRRIHFLNPNETRDTAYTGLSDGSAEFLLGALDEWLSDGDPTVQVRQFNDPLRRLCMPASASQTPSRYVAVTIRTNGQVAIDDDLRNTLPSLFRLGLQTSTSELADFLNHPEVSRFLRACTEIPPTCAECGGKDICQFGKGFGESILHRYSFVNKFRNTSLYCQSHKSLIIRLGQYALSRGVPWAIIEKNMSSMQHMGGVKKFESSINDNTQIL